MVGLCLRTEILLGNIYIRAKRVGFWKDRVGSGFRKFDQVGLGRVWLACFQTVLGWDRVGADLGPV